MNPLKTNSIHQRILKLVVNNHAVRLCIPPQNQLDPPEDTETPAPGESMAGSGTLKTNSIHQRILKLQFVIRAFTRRHPLKTNSIHQRILKRAVVTGLVPAWSSLKTNSIHQRILKPSISLLSIIDPFPLKTNSIHQRILKRYAERREHGAIKPSKPTRSTRGY